MYDHEMDQVPIFFFPVPPEYKWHKLVESILLAEAKESYGDRLIQSGIMEDASSSGDQITGQSAQW